MALDVIKNHHTTGRDVERERVRLLGKTLHHLAEAMAMGMIALNGKPQPQIAPWCTICDRSRNSHAQM